MGLGYVNMLSSSESLGVLVSGFRALLLDSAEPAPRKISKDPSLHNLTAANV